MDHAAALTEQNRLLAELCRAADPETDVPTCPGWTLRKLATHVGRGDRWAATIVRERSASPSTSGPWPTAGRPRDQDGWPTGCARAPTSCWPRWPRSVADAPVWTFIGPRPAPWWVRRRLHEATVHRADAALALGADYELPAELAADGLAEWLDLVAARPVAGAPAPLDVGATLHLHATDPDLGPAGEWLVRGGPAGVTWEHGHGKGAGGRAGAGRSTLLLAALRRIPADDGRVEVLGDGAVWRTWLERTGF